MRRARRAAEGDTASGLVPVRGVQHSEAALFDVGMAEGCCRVTAVGYVPREAFLPILEELIAGNQSALARTIEASGKMTYSGAQRRIYAILHEQQTVSLDVADRLLTGAGRPDLWHSTGLADMVDELANRVVEVSEERR